MSDPRIVSAVAFYVIGLAAIALTLRIWWTHPINRVFSIGPFVTEAGLRAILDNTPALFALGLFALSAGVARHMYWLDARGHPTPLPANFFGLIEAIFAIWAAASVIIAAVRLCRKG